MSNARTAAHLGHVDVRWATCGPDNFLGNVLAGECLDASVHATGRVGIAAVAHEAELGLDHARLDVAYANGRFVQLLHQRGRKGAHGKLGRTVHAAARVCLEAGN